MAGFEMKAVVKTVKELELISDIIFLHNEIWNHSTGIIDLLKNSTQCFVLFGEKRNVIGYAFIAEDRQRGFVEIQDIVVAPDCRQQGGGKLLINAIMDVYEEIKLIAQVQNEPLMKFYMNLGFQQDYLIENYYEIGQDGVRMSWKRENQSPFSTD